MQMLGFDECKATNGVLIHRERDLRAVAHVDDFLLSGEMQDLSWFRGKFKDTYELKVLSRRMAAGICQIPELSRQGDPYHPRRDRT